MPRYKIHQQSFIDERLVEPGQEVETHARHKPGPHWEPMDDQAKEIVAKHGVKFSPEVPDIINDMTMTSAPMANPMSLDHEALGAAIAKGIVAAQAALKAPPKGKAAEATDLV